MQTQPQADKEIQVMADTGEKNQIAGRVNAKAAETIRESKQMDAKEKASEVSGKTAVNATKDQKKKTPTDPADHKA